MKIYEYKIEELVEIHHGEAQSLNSAAEKFNILAEEGWRIIGMPDCYVVMERLKNINNEIELPKVEIEQRNY